MVLTDVHSFIETDGRRCGCWCQNIITGLSEYSNNVVSCSWCCSTVGCVQKVCQEFFGVTVTMCKYNNLIATLEGDTQLHLCA